MDLKEIMSVSGQSGLFKFVSQGRNGIIVESFADKKRSFVSASHKVSTLEDIAIFTDGEEVPLKDVLKNIHELEPGIQVPDPKSAPDDLKKFMEKVLPNYDRDRVYISDIKKLVSWYKSLLDLKLLNFEEEAAPGDKAKTKEKVEVESEAESKNKSKATTTKAKKPVAKEKKVSGKKSEK